MKTDYQINAWNSDFGREYTERNIFNPDELDGLYIERFGVKRSDMNERFLNGLKLLDKKILEVGCNVGDQLNMLKAMNYRSLSGIELQRYAVEKSKELTKEIDIIQGFADDIPFKDGYFDLVFTSGVLIHINPDRIGNVIDEIYRCSNKYIWGFEYYADNYAEIIYRGNKNLLWKADFAKVYIERHPDLKLVKEERFKYTDSDNVDSMFLLQK